MDPITFRNQPIPGIEVASMRPSNDQANTLLGIIQPPASKSLQRTSPPHLTTMPPKTREDPGPASGVEDWHYGHSKIIARKRRLRSPARSSSSMDLSWRCHPRRRMHLAAPEDLRWRPLGPFLDDLTSRSSPNAELLCDPPRTRSRAPSSR